ncbi:pentapeptide repeat-containing protein [Streptomyces sp. B6B3]|uniref:pentapeptide repeat-containing protein n=1 Tax=Streptomyces sp. B6B3 TaxID=3153570 RepID=UPI00325F1150
MLTSGNGIRRHGLTASSVIDAGLHHTRTLVLTGFLKVQEKRRGARRPRDLVSGDAQELAHRTPALDRSMLDAFLEELDLASAAEAEGTRMVLRLPPSHVEEFRSAGVAEGFEAGRSRAADPTNVAEQEEKVLGACWRLGPVDQRYGFGNGFRERRRCWSRRRWNVRMSAHRRLPLRSRPARLPRPRAALTRRSAGNQRTTPSPPDGAPASGDQPSSGLGWARRVELGSVLLASLAAVVGLWYSNNQIREELALNREQLRTAQEGQVTAQEGLITDRYTAAVTNLGDESISVRLGGVYALQLLMQDAPQNQPIITDILAAYVRTAPHPSGEAPIGEDVQAALTALHNRDRQHDRDGGFALNLSDTYLSGVQLDHKNLTGITFQGADLTRASMHHTDLTDVWLDDADLTGAMLEGAKLSASLEGADLTDASLDGADLTDVWMPDADLVRATLNSADLTGAMLDGADLTGAVLDGADLTGAWLIGADLTGAVLARADLTDAVLTNADLTDARVELDQLVTAYITQDTILPAEFAEDPSIQSRIAEVEAMLQQP